MASFWDTLSASGVALASKVVQPLGAGIGQGITNLVQQGQNKVGQLASTIVQTTDPNKPAASQPSAPPTTAVSKITTVAKTEASLGILMVVAVIALVLFLKGKK